MLTTPFCGTVWVEAGPDAGECPVCLNDNNGGSTVHVPCCGNHICAPCWNELMFHNIGTCPTCRAPIDAETGASPVQAAGAPAVYRVDSDSDSDSDSDPDPGAVVSASDMSDDESDESDESDDGDTSPLYDPEGDEPETVWGL